MTPEILFMLVLLAAALVSFVFELLPIEVTALGVLAALLATGIIGVEEALTGFSNKAVIAIGSLFVLSRALFRSGLIERAADRLSGLGGRRRTPAVAALLAGVSLISGFLNNTAVVAVLIPLVIDVSRRWKTSPSKLLIPLSYAAIFGGTLTLIGTSTNLLVAALAEEAGQPPFGMFEFSALGLIFVGIGLVYVVFAAPRALPPRADVTSLTGKYRMEAYLSEVRIPEGSPLVGKSCGEAAINRDYDTTVLAILRGERRFDTGLRDRRLEAGDILIVRGGAEDLVRLHREEGVELLPEVSLEDAELAAGGELLAEVLVAPNSRMIGRTPIQIGFRRRLGGFVLAIGRHGATLRQRIARIRLRFADTLLVLISREKLEELRQDDDVVILSEAHFERRRRRLWWLPLALIPAIIVAAAAGWLDIAGGALLGAIVVLMAGLLDTQEAYGAIDWSVIVLIAAFVPVGHALVETGTAAFLASGLLSVSELAPPALAAWAGVALLYLLTSVMTEMVSNSAAAIVLTPVAFSLAAAHGADPRPFLMAICFAASASFMTPMGYQTNLMVYGPGAYRFTDYLKLGAPLNLIFWLVAAALIPRIWPL